jgi:hypothetical protein
LRPAAATRYREVVLTSFLLTILACQIG